MTVKQIADRAARYLGQSRAQLVDESGNDLVIAAMENAKKSIQLMHDFVYCQGQVWLSIDPVTGGALTDAKLVTGDTNTTTRASVQRINNAYFADPNDSQPIYRPLLMRSKGMMNTSITEVSYRYGSVGYPYPFGAWPDMPFITNPDDPRNTTYSPYQPSISLLNNILTLEPRPAEARTVRLDAVIWLREYLQNTTISVTTSSTGSASVTLTSTAPSDFIVGTFFLGQLVTVVNGATITLAGNANATIVSATNVPYANMGTGFTTNESYNDWFVDAASEYLQYAAMCEVNMVANVFLPRQEGFNPVPEKYRDQAAEKLIEWDNFLVLNQNPFITR